MLLLYYEDSNIEYRTRNNECRRIIEYYEFSHGKAHKLMIAVDKRECVGCEECLHVCPTEAIIMKNEKAEIIQHKCNQCERCIPICPVKAIKMVYTQLK